MGGGRDDLSRVDLLGIRPVRLAEWVEEDERVVLVRPAPTSRGLRRVTDAVSYWLSPRRVRLDELGSFAWRLLDGRHTVREAVDALRERFGEAAEPAEERLGVFVRTLRHQGFLAYPEWDDVPRAKNP